MLLRKLVAVGLLEPALRRTVFQACGQFQGVDHLGAYCVAYEVAHMDATWSQCGTEAAVDIMEDASANDDVMAAAHTETASLDAWQCANCDGRHQLTKTCGKLGHFRRVSASRKSK